MEIQTQNYMSTNLGSYGNEERSQTSTQNQQQAQVQNPAQQEDFVAPVDGQRVDQMAQLATQISQMEANGEDTQNIAPLEEELGGLIEDSDAPTAFAARDALENQVADINNSGDFRLSEILTNVIERNFGTQQAQTQQAMQAADYGAGALLNIRA